MAAKKPTGRKPAASLKATSEKASEFVLMDYRVLKMTAERYLPNERAAKGYYQLKNSAGNALIPSSDESQVGMVEYKVSILGFKKGIDEQSPDEKSFFVEIAIEGKFELHNCAIQTAADVEPLIAPIIRELNVLAVDKVRAAVADLGYHAVRPQLGLRNLRTTVGELELQAPA